MEKQPEKPQQKPQPPKKKPIQKMLFQAKQKPTLIINVKVKFLREMGYQDFKDWVSDPNNVYIGRKMSHYVPGATGSKWANQFKVQEFGRDGCIKKYREWILGNEQLIKQLPNLKGKTLGCWCKPEACHGDVLVQLADKWEEFIMHKKY